MYLTDGLFFYTVSKIHLIAHLLPKSLTKYEMSYKGFCAQKTLLRGMKDRENAGV